MNENIPEDMEKNEKIYIYIYKAWVKGLEGNMTERKGEIKGDDV